MREQEFLEIVSKIESDTYLEDIEIEHNGDMYGFKVEGNLEWIDEGKYQNAEEVGMLVMRDSVGNIINRYDYGVSLGITRSGSYFSDYNYMFDEPCAFIIQEVEVPEQIIPAHTVKEKLYLYNKKKEMRK